MREKRLALVITFPTTAAAMGCESLVHRVRPWRTIPCPGRSPPAVAWRGKASPADEAAARRALPRAVLPRAAIIDMWEVVTIYLDNAATTMQNQAVIDAVTQAMVFLGNAGRGAASPRCRSYDSRLPCIARLLGCPRADHVCFTPNSTAALNTAINGVVRPATDWSQRCSSTTPCYVRSIA